MVKRRKKVKVAKILPSPSKKVPRTQGPNSDLDTIRWSFLLFDHRQIWHDKACRDEISFCKIAEKLKQYESRTWGEIESNKKRDHSVPFSSLIPQAQKRLMYIKQDDAGILWRFRFTGKQRLWGIRDGRCFYVLWWDPHHIVCPSKLKHT